MGLSYWASMEKKAWAQPHHQLSRRNPHARTHARTQPFQRKIQTIAEREKPIPITKTDRPRPSAGRRRVGRKNDRSMLVSDGWSIAKGGFRRYTINKHNWTLTTRQQGRDKSHDGQVRARWPRWRLSSDAAGKRTRSEREKWIPLGGWETGDNRRLILINPSLSAGGSVWCCFFPSLRLRFGLNGMNWKPGKTSTLNAVVALDWIESAV